jgi:hypothetical protein
MGAASTADRNAVDVPHQLLLPVPDWSDAYYAKVADGRDRLRNSSVAFVGLARNCAAPLESNLQKLEQLADCCGSWRLHIEANDCEDNTLGVLDAFAKRHGQATYRYQILGRESYGHEFAGRRTVAMAEYRTACQRWVRACAADADYVVVIDWDAWGGWLHDGVLNTVGWLVETPGAYGMAAVSLFQYDWGSGPQWAHYDLWALRGVGQADCYWDTYRNGFGGFGYSWLPPVGSPPALVSSAFGGMAIYRTDAYLKGVYDGATECEHVTYHRSVAEATGRHLYVCPGLRTVMSWMPKDGRQHRTD